MVYAVLLVGGVRKFRQWVHETNEEHEDTNLLTQEYAVELHGLPKKCTPQQVQAHMQAAMKRWLELAIQKAEAKPAGGARRAARLERLREPPRSFEPAPRPSDNCCRDRWGHSGGHAN